MNRMCRYIRFFLLLQLVRWVLPVGPVASAQHFSGVQGSVYAPVIHSFDQPAAGAGMPYRWGLELVGVNTQWTNNIVSLSPAKINWRSDSLNLNPYFIRGKATRWGNLRNDVSVLHFLMRLPGYEKWTVGFGWSIRGSITMDHMDYDYVDSMNTASRFLKANAVNQPQSGRLVGQQWMQWYATASALLRDNKMERLAVGARLSLLRGMGAALIDVPELMLQSPKGNTLPLARFRGQYGYSQNLEDLDEQDDDPTQTLSKGSPLSVGLDIGLEYTRKKPIYIAGFTNDDPADYDWKAGASLTDFGRLKYPLGEASRIITGVKPGADLAFLQQTLQDATSLEAFNDSLAKGLDMAPWEGDASITLPTALHLYFDKNLGRHVYLNAQLALDASFLVPAVTYQTRIVNHLIVTPRWEIKRFSAALPLYVNTHGTVLAGIAGRIGPLVLGLHDMGWLFGHHPNGGAYIGLVIKSFSKKPPDCPTF